MLGGRRTLQVGALRLSAWLGVPAAARRRPPAAAARRRPPPLAPARAYRYVCLHAHAALVSPSMCNSCSPRWRACVRRNVRATIILAIISVKKMGTTPHAHGGVYTDGSASLTQCLKPPDPGRGGGPPRQDDGFLFQRRCGTPSRCHGLQVAPGLPTTCNTRVTLYHPPPSTWIRSF